MKAPRKPASNTVEDRVCERFTVVMEDGRRVVLRVHTEQPLPVLKTPHLRAPSAGEFLFALHALSPKAEALAS